MSNPFRFSAVAAVVIAALAPAAGAAGVTAGGAQQWAASSTGQQNQGAAGFGTAVSPDGATVFAAGSEFVKGATASGFALAGQLVAYDAATGAARWAAAYPSGGHSQAVFDSVAVSPDGSTVFVSGFAEPDQGGSASYLTAAYDAATGVRIWARTTPGPGAASAPEVSPDGSTVFVTGPSGTVAFRAATGAVRWTTPGAFSSAALSPDGTVLYVSGKLDTAAYRAATGATLWTASYDSKLVRESGAIRVAPDGSTVFVTGLAFNQSTKATLYPLVAYAADSGARLWVRTLPRATESAVFSAGAIAVSPDGSAVFITEPRGTAPPYFFTTAAYGAATGPLRWVRNFTSPDGETDESAITVSPDGSKVFVTGDAAYSSGFDRLSYATVAYASASGSTLWVARHRDLAQNNAYAVAVSPDTSRVYVTGESQILPDQPTFRPGRMDTIAYGS